MKKEINHAFGKNIYLLGKDKEGKRVWLSAPSWDCSWYWGFGYISGYTNDLVPSRSRDITYHMHWKGSVTGHEMSNNGDYCHNPKDSKLFSDTTFTEQEGWELGELFSQFYFLKEAAEHFRHGKDNVASASIPLWKDEAKEKEINEVIIPQVTKRIMEILTPKDSNNE